ncbi:LytTR family DNA-binding domain-containing protein [Xanthobacter sp. VTT E-85241]|uniref:LytR/AlgR family response regulator transcription factor n=1 Tax=Roseixanthobacter finlandensis TaxID=3119922 RepID=UPI00372AE388
MLSAVIVDDEVRARRAIARLLEAHPQVRIAGEADCVEDALDLLVREAPDLVFLDIELGDGSGFELIQALEDPPRVIFVTAHAEHAAEAFAVDAVDYLLKPVSPERLADALRRAMRRIRPDAASPEAAAPGTAPVAEPSPPALAPGATLELRTPHRTVFAPPSEIVALRADGDFTRVFLAGQPPLMMLRTLGTFETLLPRPPFLRLGRSLMVNCDRLRSIETPSRDRAHVALEGLPAPLILGRAATSRLREALADKGRL